MTGICLCAVGGGNARKSHRSDAEKLADERHSVRGELPAAGAGAGACGAFQGLELRVRHSAASMHADGFEDILNRDGVAFELAGGDRTAVENQSGNIQSRQGHNAAGNGFVATDKDNERIKEIAARDEFDGVRDDFAADEGSAHALGAHGDAIGNGDGVEFERSAAGGANPVFYVLCEFAKVIVAGTDFDPGVGHADQGLAEILVTKAGGSKHGASGRTMRSVGESVTARFGRRIAHYRVPSTAIDFGYSEIRRLEKLSGSSPSTR